MAKNAKNSKKQKIKVTSAHRKLAAQPGTVAMMARVGGCNKAPIIWRKNEDAYEEGFLKSDCTYGNWQVVDASDVPADVRKQLG